MAVLRRPYRRATVFFAMASCVIGMLGGWVLSPSSSQTQIPPRDNKPTTSLNVSSKSDHSLTVPGDTSIKAPPEGTEPDHGHDSDTEVQPIPGNEAAQGAQTPTPTVAPTNPPSG